MASTAAQIWRDFITDGVSSSGAHKPIKSEIRAWGTDVETTFRGTLAITKTASGALSNPQFGVYPFNSIVLSDMVDGHTAGLFVYHEIPVGHTEWTGTKRAVEGVVLQLATPTGGTLNQLIGGAFTARAAVAAGPGQQGVFGINPQAYLSDGATGFVGCVGGEIDVCIGNSASATDRMGLQIVSVTDPVSGNGGVNGTSIDGGLVIGTTPTAAKWKNACYLFANAIHSTGAVLSSQASAGTIATGIDLSNFTIIGNAFSSNNFTVSGNGSLVASAVTGLNGIGCGGFINSNSATGGIGYGTGAGGTVVQSTSKSNPVTLNTVTGRITMNNAALNAGTIISFVFNNSAVTATDEIRVWHESGGTTGGYTVNGRATGAGTAAIDVRNNTAANLSEALVLRFAIGRSVNN